MKYLWPILCCLIFFACSKTEEKLAQYVDPFIGTGGHGHTFPGPTRPFGMVQLGPDTRLDGWDGCSGYHYSDSIIYGFSHTHLSGTGVSDYGDILLMPFIGETFFNNGADGSPGYRSPFQKKNETARAGYYKVLLDKHNILAELTTTERAGMHRYTFPKGKEMKLLIDLEHRDQVISSNLRQVSEYSLKGHRYSRAWARNQRVYFNIEFNQPIHDIQFDTSGVAGRKAAILFKHTSNQLIVKVALSPVAELGAKNNMATELHHWNFDQVRLESEQAWEKQLRKIEVEGGTKSQKRIFYTALYHTMIAPNVFMDANGGYRGLDGEVYESQDFVNYTVFSLWDTYRSTHPLYTLIEQKRTTDFIKTFLQHYKTGGLLPVWELAGNETDCMIGYHSVSVIADAYLKGISDFDVDLALEAMQKSANQDRLGINHFRDIGFIPSELEAESVSKTLEYAYDDWCIAVFAQALGKREIAETYFKRAQHYKNVFDAQTGFMRARVNNQWFAPFRPEEVNFNYTEANSWQYSYYVPHDVETWMELLGGDEKAEAKLDAIFNAPPETSGREQADITGLIGQYAHGNEPSHHIPYLYNFVGAPHKTQYRVRQIMNELYSDKPDGLSGNEDCGQMSAWLVFSAMGFYPVTPGKPEYILGSPWFEKITINLENGKTFVVKARNQSNENVYVQRIELNDEPYPLSYIRHQDIMNGGELEFRMDDTPNLEFGRAKEHRPTSKLAEQLVTVPVFMNEKRVFFDELQIELTCLTRGATIFYRRSDKPNEQFKYNGPFMVSNSVELFTWAEKGALKSQEGSGKFFKIPSKRSIKLATSYANHYTAGGDLALIDLIRGGNDFRAGNWQGYEGVNLDAVVDLGEMQPVKKISIGFLQDENSWIFMPLEVLFMVSENGTDFRETGKVKNTVDPLAPGTIIRDFSVMANTRARYIRVVGINRGTCPPEHKAAGGKCWIFADEIEID
jgi:predicted alpha-1,2-mannosidase